MKDCIACAMGFAVLITALVGWVAHRFFKSNKKVEMKPGDTVRLESMVKKKGRFEE